MTLKNKLLSLQDSNDTPAQKPPELKKGMHLKGLMKNKMREIIKHTVNSCTK